MPESMKKTIDIPASALVVMVGASSSGKTTFARRFFKDTEVLSSDFFRGMAADDENDQGASADAFALLCHAAEIRLRRGLTTVIDATNLRKEDRKRALRLAKEHDVHAAAIVLDLPERELLERNAARDDRNITDKAVRRQAGELARGMKKLKKEGFRFVHVLRSGEEIDGLEVVRTRLWNDRKDEHGPFDVIGDVHGCHGELVELLEALGYGKDGEGAFRHPEGRKAVFLGDLCDRGPMSVPCMKLVMGMARAGARSAFPATTTPSCCAG